MNKIELRKYLYLHYPCGDGTGSPEVYDRIEEKIEKRTITKKSEIDSSI